MIIALYIIVGMYCIGLTAILLAWHNISTQQYEAVPQTWNSLSVLIPIRNEEENISGLLNCLNNQNYPIDKYDVVVINDHSTDQSLKVVNEHLSQLKCSAQIIDLDNQSIGKKSAIKEGINRAKGEIIVTVDGDCLVNNNWLFTMNNAFQNPKIAMAFGAVSYINRKGLLTAFQKMELSILITIGAVMNRIGLPSMCNGANLAFRKSNFHEVGGFAGNEHVPSGDDEFLLRKFHEKNPESVRFIKSLDNIVQTQSTSTIAELIQQKMRWASKWRHHKDRATWLMAIFVFMANLTFIGVGVLGGLDNISLNNAAALIGMKILTEIVVIAILLKWYGNRISFLLTMLFSILYPFYAIIVGVLSSFGRYRWKGREY